MQKKIVKTFGGLVTAPCEPVEMSSLQALWKGEADAEQQRKALVWILEGACGIHEMSYVPGDDGKTIFNEGRRFVGKQIAEILRTNVTLLIEGLRRIKDE